MIVALLLAWTGARLSAPWWYWALLIAYAWYRMIVAIVRVWQKGGERIANTFQRWLLICIVVAYLVTSTFTFFLQKI